MKKIINHGLQTTMLLLVLLLNFCAKKQTLIWQGQHADIETHEQPKEDFKVNKWGQTFSKNRRLGETEIRRKGETVASSMKKLQRGGKV